jgi:hypothetical protein
MKLIKLIIFLLLCVSTLGCVFAVNLTEYGYVSDIKVSCEEYKGFVKFELPDEFVGLKSPKTNMDVDYSIERVSGGQSYFKNSNWYVKKIDSFDVNEVEKIFDNNFNSYLVSELGDSIEFVFENPQLQKIEKITLDVKDSSINSIKVYDGDSEVDFLLKSNNFHYELIFTEPVNYNSLRFNLEFNDILKIKEISFFEKISYDEKSFVYFYVDNNCNNNFKFYFGEFGYNNGKFGSKFLPVEFETLVETYKNSLYVNDFDVDGILNPDDNCLLVSNVDQKDINYNNIGDACEDDDKDGVANSIDNCLDDYNRNQLDNDGDGIGNKCDEEDGRFFEKNSYLIYIFAGLIGILFVFFSIKIFKKE